jgi:hypothetical protein
MYNRPIGAGGIWATTLAFGSNQARETIVVDVLDATTGAVLIESSLTLSERHSVFVRGELGGIPAHHLHALEYATSIFTVGKAQVGYVRHFRARKGVVPGLGGTAAFSVVPPALAPRYSGRVSPTLGIFFSLRAGRHAM